MQSGFTQALESVPGVQAISPSRVVEVKVASASLDGTKQQDDTLFYVAIDPAQFRQVGSAEPSRPVDHRRVLWGRGQRSIARPVRAPGTRCRVQRGSRGPGVSNIGRIDLPDTGTPYRLETILPFPPIQPGEAMALNVLLSRSSQEVDGLRSAA